MKYIFKLIIFTFFVQNLFSNSTSDLKTAIENGNINKVKSAINRKANVNYKVEGDMPLINYAIFYYIGEENTKLKKDRFEIIQLMIQQGADLSYQTGEGIHSIFYTIMNDNSNTIDLLKLVLSGNTGIEKPNDKTPSLFQYLCSMDSPNILERVRLLLDKNIYLGNGGQDAILYCKFYADKNAQSHLTVIKELLKSNKKIELNNPSESFLRQTGTSPAGFILLDQYFSEEMFQLLLKKGFDPNITQPKVTSPVCLAVSEKDYKTAEMILDRVKNLQNINCFSDKFSLLHAAVTSDQVEVVKYLLKKGLNKNVKNKEGETPLDLAKKRENTEIISLLE
jgi:ankyrin repeat protein